MTTPLPKKARRVSDEALWASRSEEILDAAVRLFSRHGYAGTDTQLLADELGVGKGTLYRYFPSKEDLFLAAADRAMRQLRQTIDAAIHDIPDPLDQLATAVRAYLAHFAANPDHVELLIQERAQFKDRKQHTYFEHRDASVERWRGVYRALIAEGRIRPMPVEHIMDVLSQLLYGTIFINYFTGRKQPAEDQAREILDVLFRGILSDTERPRWRT